MRKKTAIAIIAVAVISIISFLVVRMLITTDRKVVRLGFLPITADVSLFIALEKGYFEQEGVKVEPVRFTRSNQAMDAVMSGRTDGAIMIGYSTLFTIFSQNPNVFRIVQSGVETEDKYTARIIVPIESSIHKLEDLKGKSVGTYSGLTQRLNLILVLSHFFEDPEKVIEIKQVESNLQVPSLAAGSFDSLFTIDPHATVAINKGIGRSICDSPRAKYITDPFPTCSTVLSTSFLDEEPEIAMKVINALTVASNWATQNPKEAALIIAKEEYTGVSEEVALKCGTYEWWMLGEEKIPSVQKLADIMYENGLIRRRIDVSEMFADIKP